MDTERSVYLCKGDHSFNWAELVANQEEVHETSVRRCRIPNYLMIFLSC